MAFSVSVRLSPGQLAALDALVREEGSTRVGHIRAGLRMRLDLDLHRKAVQKIVSEEVKAGIQQVIEAALAAEDSNRQLLASFLKHLHDDGQVSPPSAPAPAPSTGGGVVMPARSR